MRVGVYIDGFNLYYGAKSHCQDNSTGWRWLDVKKFTEASVASFLDRARRDKWSSYDIWKSAEIDRVVYCTARINARADAFGAANQEAYLTALRNSGVVDHFEYGYYQRKTKTSPLAVRGPRPGFEPILVTSAWPVMVQDSDSDRVENARYIVSHLHVEEKGSDVNVGSHLLIDTLSSRIDAAIVVSNDSDLRFPIAHARKSIPVGVISPHKGHLAGALRISEPVERSKDWGWLVTPEHFTLNQLPDVVGNVTKPSHW